MLDSFNVDCRYFSSLTDDILTLLLEAGADPNIGNDKCQYPLHFAAFQRHPSTVRLLLDHGANPFVLDRKGRTPAEDTSDPTIRAMIQDAQYHWTAGPQRGG